MIGRNMMTRTAGKSILRLVFLLLVLLLLLYIGIQSPLVKRKIYPLKYKESIIKYSTQYNLDPHLVMAVIWVESKYEPKATSRKDARGLMQIIPPTGQWIAKEIGLETYSDDLLYEPDINIRMGCWYLSYLLKVFEEDIELALAAYNGGMGNVRKWLNDSRYSKDGLKLDFIPFKETSQYIDKVAKAYEQYKKLYKI